MKTLVLIAIAALLAPASMEDVTDLLPPDGTPSGWSREGNYEIYDSSDLAVITSTPDAYINNGLVKAVLQKYTDGSNTLTVCIFELSGTTSAGEAFNQAAAGKEITADLGNGAVLESTSIFFTGGKYVVHIFNESGDAAMSQNIAAMAMTIDAYLLGM